MWTSFLVNRIGLLLQQLILRRRFFLDLFFYVCAITICISLRRALSLSLASNGPLKIGFLNNYISYFTYILQANKKVNRESGSLSVFFMHQQPQT